VHREGLALQLRGRPNIAIAGSGDLAEAQRASRSGWVDVVLLDKIQLDLAAVASLRAARRRLRIIAIGIREVDSEVLACAAAGIDGYVRMEATIGDLIVAIESVMRNELVMSPRVAASLYHSVASLGGDGAVTLTSRELQIAELINRGLSNKEISNHLNIETCTAKNHVQNLMQKLGVHRRGQAAAKLRNSIGQRFG
jgi:two-component system, NarL family, nitrate/nitrite response regulator NarL